MIKRMLILLVLINLQNICAQDPVFTQFYASPTILNPAFVGSTGNTRLGVGYRDQWIKNASKLSTFYAVADGYIESINSGIGINLVNQREELTNYSYTQLNLMYSFQVRLNEKWTFFPGISFGYAYKQYNFNGLLFEDQINIGDGSIDPTTDPYVENDNVHFFDLSVGGVLYSNNAWIGLSLRHLTNPNIAFTAQEELPLELFLSIHGGYRFTLRSDDRYSSSPEGTFLFVTFNYMNQAQFNRLDFGVEFEISKFFIGVLTSATVDKIVDESQTFMSINPLVGLEYNKFKIGLSYDFPISNIGNNAGTAEITLQYYIGNNTNRKRRWQVKN